MASIEELKTKMAKLKGEFESSDKIKDINDRLIKYLNEIDNNKTQDNTDKQIEKIVKIIKNCDKWKFNSWNIPTKLRTKDNEHAWSKTFAKEFIKICIELSRVDCLDEVKKICDKLTSVDEKNAGVSALSISAILHCVQPNFIPILSNKAYEDIYNLCHNYNYKYADRDKMQSCKAEYLSSKSSLNRFAKNIYIINHFCEDNKLDNQKKYKFALIDNAALKIDEEEYGSKAQYLKYLDKYFVDDPDLPEKQSRYQLKGNDDCSVCREERQFALFLYQKLFDMVSMTKAEIEQKLNSDIYLKIRKACGLEDNDIIKSVYYEASFMRDFLYRDKSEHSNKESCTFNNKLFEFTKEIFDSDLKHLLDHNENNTNLAKLKVEPSLNYGANSPKNKLPEPMKRFMRAMMNSKPDLGIIYETKNNEKLHLKFIECKYKSGEGYVKLKDVEKKVNQDKKNALVNGDLSHLLLQTVTQYYITKFICIKLFNNKMIYDFPVLLKFGNETTEMKNKEDNKWYYIPDELLNKTTKDKYRTKIEEHSLSILDIVPQKMKDLNLFKKKIK